MNQPDENKSPLPATNAPAAEGEQYDAEKMNQFKIEHDAWFNKNTYTLAMGIMELDTKKNFSLRGFKAAAIPRDERIKELETSGLIMGDLLAEQGKIIAKLESDCPAMLEFIKWGDKQIDQLLAHCGKDECEDCALAVCPFKDELHFHHDGCPSCANVPDNHPLAKFTKEIATDSGARLSEKMQRYERALTVISQSVGSDNAAKLAKEALEGK